MTETDENLPIERTKAQRGAGRPLGCTKLEASRRRAVALSMRIRGASMAAIGKELDITPQAASSMVKGALRVQNEQERLDAADLRQIAHERLEALIRRMWVRAFPNDLGAEPDYKAVDSIMRAIRRDAEMMGYESPKKYDLDIRLVQQQVGVVVEAIARVLPDEDMPRIHAAIGEALKLLENQEANRGGAER